MSLRSFVSSRFVTPEGGRRGRVLVEGETILGVVPAQASGPRMPKL